MKNILHAFLLIWFLALPRFVVAEELASIPKLRGPVEDLVGIVDRRAEQRLVQLLFDYNDKGKSQIQVLVVPTTNPETIEQYSMRVVEKWKLGTAKQDNGILFLVAVNDKKMRIEVGQGLEGALPDIAAKRIISDLVTPLFRTGRFSDGVEAAVAEIIFQVDKEYADQNLQRPSQKKIPLSALFTLGFCLSVIIGAARTNGGRSLHRGRSRYDGYGGGWPLGGGSSGSSGGGWSGGGGGFSGGGASGGW